ncbi:MAG TPA: tetratricopeptide repeat protein, partial [Planctomycetaceae bacterium]|nr:tetratricopeptide repeat protein [Planctomycetaceae bacterium]
REDWQTAWRVQRRLAALKPTSYGERRDLAILAAKAGQLPQAVELLRHCLKEGPSKDTPLLTSYLQTVELQLASWN